MDLVVRLVDQVSPGAKSAQASVRALREESEALLSRIEGAGKLTQGLGSQFKGLGADNTKAAKELQAGSKMVEDAAKPKAAGGSDKKGGSLELLGKLGLIVGAASAVAKLGGTAIDAGKKFMALALGITGMGRLQAISARLSENFRGLFKGVNPKPVLDSLDRLSRIFNSKSFVGAAISDGINRTFKSISDLIVATEPYIKSFTESLVIGALTAELAWWELRGALVPITEPISDIIDKIVALGEESKILKSIEETFDLTALAAYKVFQWIGKLVDNIIDIASETKALQPLVDTFDILSDTIGDLMKDLFGLSDSVDGNTQFWKFFGEYVATFVVGSIKLVGSTIKSIAGVFSGTVKIFSGVIKAIAGLFSGDWALAFQGLQDIVYGGVKISAAMFFGLVEQVAIGVDYLGKLLGKDVGATKWVEGLEKAFDSKLRSALSQPSIKQKGVDGGLAVGDGVEQGLMDSEGKATAAGEKLAKAVEKGFKKGAKIESPSKLFRADARMLGAGVEQGIEDSQGGVQRAADTHLVPKPKAGGSLGSGGDVISPGRKIVYQFFFPNLASTGDTKQDIMAAVKKAITEIEHDAAVELGVDLSEEAPEA